MAKKYQAKSKKKKKKKKTKAKKKKSMIKNVVQINVALEINGRVGGSSSSGGGGECMIS